MKKNLIAIIIWIMLAICLAGCRNTEAVAQIAATTLPVFDFTSAICEGTDLHVTRLITEEVSCLHDYSLNVRQVKAAESADVIVMSGAGLEEFLDDMLHKSDVIDSAKGIDLICPESEAEAEHDHKENTHEGHHHEQDPHIWLSPKNALVMANNICDGLVERYPEYSEIFFQNLHQLTNALKALDAYGTTALSNLSSREIITFHDGFSYLAKCYDLTILEAVEEESGSEASAKELIHMIHMIEEHDVKAIFTEISGSTSAASIISKETGVVCAELDMAMAGNSYFEAMYHNIDTLKEALQ